VAKQSKLPREGPSALTPRAQLKPAPRPDSVLQAAERRCATATSVAAIRDQTGITFGVHGRGIVWRDLRDDFVAGQSRWQFLRIKIGSDQNEGVMMWHRIWWRAWSGIEADAPSAFAANVFIGWLAYFAFGSVVTGAAD
jgi:hypothetical protein